MKRAGLTLGAALIAGAALAHPHAFIDADVALIVTARGALDAVQVDWTYTRSDSEDILAGRGILMDKVVTEQELEALVTTEIDWAEVPGDLEVAQGGRVLDLGPISVPQALYVNGRLTLRHQRSLVQPALPEGGAVDVRVFDRTFYVAYSLEDVVPLPSGASCTQEVIPADLDAAGRILGEALSTLPQEASAEGAFPEVGEYFADTIRLDCAAE